MRKYQTGHINDDEWCGLCTLIILAGLAVIAFVGYRIVVG